MMGTTDKYPRQTTLLLLLIIVPPYLCHAQTKRDRASDYEGDVYAGLFKEMNEATKKLWDREDGFEQRFKDLIDAGLKSPRYDQPLCKSSFRTEVEELDRLLSSWATTTKRFYEYHLKDAILDIAETERLRVKLSERMGAFNTAINNVQREQKLLLDQKAELAKSNLGGDEKARLALDKAIGNAAQRSAFLESAKKDLGDALLAVSGTRVDRVQRKDDANSAISLIDVNAQYWQSHFDFRKAQFDLICPPKPLPPPPIRPPRGLP